MAFWRANAIPGLSSKNADEWMFNMNLAGLLHTSNASSQLLASAELEQTLDAFP